MLDYLNKANLRPALILKVAGLAAAAIIVLVLAFNLIGSFVRPLSSVLPRSGKSISQSALSLSSGRAEDSYDSSMPELSARNVFPLYESGGATGNTAEDFEITEYNGVIETRNKTADCGTISGLKAKDYVIFENANEYDQSCNFVFKVETDHRQEILNVIDSLHPKELIESTETIKKRLDDFSSEIEILTKKKETIENTLSSAIISYDEIARVATQARDAESLAKIIDSKVRIIESLSQQRIDINAQLDRLSRAQADQIDRLDYVFFRINIYENRFIDPESLKDSWKLAIQEFVRDLNDIAQNISISLITSLFIAFQIILYLLVFVFLAKLVWKLFKFIWRR